MLEELLRLLGYSGRKVIFCEDWINGPLDLIQVISNNEVEFRFEGWSIILNEDGTWKIDAWETGA